jgi:hypothetical protein
VSQRAAARPAWPRRGLAPALPGVVDATVEPTRPALWLRPEPGGR